MQYRILWAYRIQYLHWLDWINFVLESSRGRICGQANDLVRTATPGNQEAASVVGKTGHRLPPVAEMQGTLRKILDSISKSSPQPMTVDSPAEPALMMRDSNREASTTKKRRKRERREVERTRGGLLFALSELTGLTEEASATDETLLQNKKTKTEALRKASSSSSGAPKEDLTTFLDGVATVSQMDDAFKMLQGDYGAEILNAEEEKAVRDCCNDALREKIGMLNSRAKQMAEFLRLVDQLRETLVNVPDGGNGNSRRAQVAMLALAAGERICDAKQCLRGGEQVSELEKKLKPQLFYRE